MERRSVPKKAGVSYRTEHRGGDHTRLVACAVRRFAFAKALQETLERAFESGGP
jgi:hypothetical protein